MAICCLAQPTTHDLGSVSLHLDQLSTTDSAIKRILQKHSSVFDGLGKLKGDTISLSIDASQVPKALPQLRIPYLMRKKVESALKEL